MLLTSPDFYHSTRKIQILTISHLSAGARFFIFEAKGETSQVRFHVINVFVHFFSSKFEFFYIQ